jgi:hypothetical protein
LICNHPCHILIVGSYGCVLLFTPSHCCCHDCNHTWVVKLSLCMKILTIVDYCSIGVAEIDGHKLISTYCALSNKDFKRSFF